MGCPLVKRLEDRIDRACLLARAALGAKVVVDVALGEVDGSHGADFEAFAAVVALFGYCEHVSPSNQRTYRL